MLEVADHQDAVVAGNDVFGAVAVVHVKVDDGDALQAVTRHGVLGGNRHVVEEAETHGLVAAGMVAGRAHGAEGVFQFSGQHGIDRLDGCTGCQQRSAVGLAVHGGIGIEREVLRITSGDIVFFQPVTHAAHGGNMHAAMGQLDLGQVGGVGLATLQRIGHAGDQQAIFNGIQAFRGFRVAGAHIVQFAIIMKIVARGAHCPSPKSLVNIL